VGTRSGSTELPTGSTNGAAAGSATSGGHTVTAEQIAADTKAIDAAEIEVQIAEANRSNATLRSPIAGTVGTVGIGKGKSVSASSSSSAITVVGTGALSVSLSIGLSDIDLVKVGQAARVTVDGRSTPVPAKVSYVGVLDSGSDTGASSTYTVSVQLDKIDTALYDGMGASVAIDVGTATDVLTVPLSAVHTTGTRHTVDVYRGGKSIAKLVTVGVAGDDRVEVKSGLSGGDQVIIADLSASIPSSTNNINRRGNTGSLSGLTGRGFGPGFGGGGPGGR
jgi:multidrug efflux pump subunit AcrA (membrane-fusion protein)